METPIGEEDDSHLGDFIKDENNMSPEEYAENELGERLFAGESKQVLFEKSYKNLSPRERREMSDDFKEIKSFS